MDRHVIRAVEWLPPLLFALTAAWVIWTFPEYILAFGGGDDALALRYPNAGKGLRVVFDLAMLGLLAVLFAVGVAISRPNAHDAEAWGGMDRASLFLGRVCMVVIAMMVCIMTWEVFVRYFLGAPTLWANELSLWSACFVFLLAGLYAMQQRNHIRIFLIYDLFPRWLQRVCDMVSTLLIFAFAAAMVWGSFREARDKLLRWETFGTAFDPPIPATIKPMIILVICLVALQALSNLICDWNKAKKIHTAADDIEGLEELKAAVGVKD